MLSEGVGFLPPTVLASCFFTAGDAGYRRSPALDTRFPSGKFGEEFYVALPGYVYVISIPQISSSRKPCSHTNSTPTGLPTTPTRVRSMMRRRRFSSQSLV